MAEKALGRFREAMALDNPNSLERDAAIQRLRAGVMGTGLFP